MSRKLPYMVGRTQRTRVRRAGAFVGNMPGSCLPNLVTTRGSRPQHRLTDEALTCCTRGANGKA